MNRKALVTIIMIATIMAVIATALVPAATVSAATANPIWAQDRRCPNEPRVLIGPQPYPDCLPLLDQVTESTHKAWTAPTRATGAAMDTVLDELYYWQSDVDRTYFKPLRDGAREVANLEENLAAESAAAGYPRRSNGAQPQAVTPEHYIGKPSTPTWSREAVPEVWVDHGDGQGGHLEPIEEPPPPHWN